MTEVLFNAETRAVLGPDGITQASTAVLTKGTCSHCGGSLDRTPAVTAQVFCSARMVVVGYAHPACSPPSVEHIDATARQDQAALDVLTSSALDMSISAVSLPQRNSGFLPALVAEVHAGIFDSEPDLQTGTTDRFLAAAIAAHGFTATRNLRNPPRALLSWSARLTTPDQGPASHLDIHDHRGQLFFTGTVDPDPLWTAQALHLGWCPLYYGTVGLPQLHAAGQLTEHSAAKALRRAATSGRLAEARLPLTAEATPGHAST